MEQEKKDRLAMLADPASPFWGTVLGEITMETLYQASREGLAKAGILISRQGFLSIPGLVQLTPVALAKLADLGVEITGFSITPPIARQVQNHGK